MIVEGGGLMWVTIESLCCTIEANVICYLKNILVKIHIKNRWNNDIWYPEIEFTSNRLILPEMLKSFNQKENDTRCKSGSTQGNKKSPEMIMT